MSWVNTCRYYMWVGPVSRENVMLSRRGRAVTLCVSYPITRVTLKTKLKSHHPCHLSKMIQILYTRNAWKAHSYKENPFRPSCIKRIIKNNFIRDVSLKSFRCRDTYPALPTYYTARLFPLPLSSSLILRNRLLSFSKDKPLYSICAHTQLQETIHSFRYVEVCSLTLHSFLLAIIRQTLQTWYWFESVV